MEACSDIIESQAQLVMGVVQFGKHDAHPSNCGCWYLQSLMLYVQCKQTLAMCTAQPTDMLQQYQRSDARCLLSTGECQATQQLVLQQLLSADLSATELLWRLGVWSDHHHLIASFT